MLVATCSECRLEASLDAADVVEGDLRCQACDGALVLAVAETSDGIALPGSRLYLDDSGAFTNDDGYDDDYGEDDGYDDGYTEDPADLYGDGPLRGPEGSRQVGVSAFGGDLSVNFEGVFAGGESSFAGLQGEPSNAPPLADDAEVAFDPDLGDDPFAQAAAQLDSSISATIQRTRRNPAYDDDELPPLLEDREFLAGNLDDTVEAARTEILEGEAPTEEPLPSFDGGDTYWIESLAEERPQFSMAPPLSLDATQGVPAISGDETGEIDLPLGSVTPEPEELAEDPLEGTQRTPLFGDEAVDWLALLDDNLTESTEDDPTAERVYIQLPESATPNAALEEEQFKEAVRQLEEGGAEAFAKSYGKSGRIDMSAATQAISEAQDSRRLAQVDTRNWSQEEGTQELGDSTVPLSAIDTAGRIKVQNDSTVPLSAIDTAGRIKVQNDGTLPLSAMDTGRVEARSEPPPAPKEQGTLEWNRANADPSLVTLLAGNSHEADYFRQLYQRVFHSERGEAPRVVLVTSAHPGAGKTTVATNLALVAARSPHRRAFLIDADPRGGGLLSYLGIGRRVEGLLESLGADEDPAKRLLPLDVPGDLRVLPLGIPGSEAIDLLGSDRRVGDLLSRLRSVDPQAVIVIDGSFALNVADPLVWARLVDGVILVARAGKTAKADLRQALELIGFEKVLGVVLNDTRARKR